MVIQMWITVEKELFQNDTLVNKWFKAVWADKVDKPGYKIDTRLSQKGCKKIEIWMIEKWIILKKKRLSKRCHSNRGPTNFN